ncbi:MAG: hypothetical protein NTX52_14535 [Planctomycetota bacterium]|nr:hypothetical protein [Planctomycetota bacterium]
MRNRNAFHGFGACLSCPINQVVSNSQIEFPGGLKARVACHLRYIIFPKSIGKPIRQACTPQIMKAPVRNTNSPEDGLELTLKVVEGIRTTLDTPLALHSQLLNVIVPCGRDEHIRVPLKIPRFYQQVRAK